MTRMRFIEDHPSGSLDISSQIESNHPTINSARMESRDMTAYAAVRDLNAYQRTGANSTISVTATYMPYADR